MAARVWCLCVFVFLTLSIAEGFLASSMHFMGQMRSRQTRVHERVLALNLRGGATTMRYGANSESTSTILLVRHGQTEWNVQGKYQGQKDSPLTILGRKEAQALGQRLRESQREIHSIWSSDLARASDTAEEVVSALKTRSGVTLEIRKDARLRERSFGILEGLTREECRNNHPEEMLKFGSDADYAISGGGESRSTLVARTESALIEIAKQTEGKTCVVVTHGAVVSTFMRYILGIPFTGSGNEQPKADLQIRNTCICEIKHLADGKWLVLSVGDVAHTEELRKNEPQTSNLTRESRSVEQA